jgi:hypothetical protein
MLDLLRPLTSREAGRISTELEQRNIHIKLRYFIGFSPEKVAKMQVAKSHNLTAESIAEMAGRERVNV